MTTSLPPLELDCPYCTGPAGDEMRRANTAAWKAWNAEEQGAYSEFAAEYDRTHEYGGAYEAWLNTDRMRDLKYRMPEELSEVGCVECDYTGRQLTDAGRQVLDFARRWMA